MVPEINSDNPMKYGLVETNGGAGGINGGVGPENDGGKRVSIYAQVVDLQATLDRAVELGGKVILPRLKSQEVRNWRCSPILQGMLPAFF